MSKIRYTEDKIFTKEQVEKLFLSVNWVSGKYPNKLFRALNNSTVVITAWSGDELVGLVRVLDDGEMLAYLHYLLVRPDFQGRGIAGTLVNLVKEKYRNFMYIELMPEDVNNVSFYEKFGFEVFEGGTPMIRR